MDPVTIATAIATTRTLVKSAKHVKDIAKGLDDLFTAQEAEQKPEAKGKPKSRTQQIINIRAKEGDERALTEIALLATSRRPDLKDRNFNAIVEAIRGALPTIEMDMGMESTEMQGLIKGKETAIEGLKPKNQNILHGLATGTDKRDLRRQRESLTSDLDEVYDVYRRGQEDYVSNEFSIVDTLFNKEELGLG